MVLIDRKPKNLKGSTRVEFIEVNGNRVEHRILIKPDSKAAGVFLAPNNEVVVTYISDNGVMRMGNMAFNPVLESAEIKKYAIRDTGIAEAILVVAYERRNKKIYVSESPLREVMEFVLDELGLKEIEVACALR